VFLSLHPSEKREFFPIYSNSFEMKNLVFNKDNYTVGDKVIINYDLIHDYDSTLLKVWLKNSLTGKSKKVIVENYLDKKTQPTGILEFTIPDDNDFTGENFYLYIEMSDSVDNSIKLDSPTFLINANTKLPAPFNDFIEIYTTLNTNFPSNVMAKSSYNLINKTIIDENNMVHMIVSSIASYVADVYLSYKNIDYYYVTYDFNSKKISSPIKILSTNKNNQIRFKDFILIENEPFVLFNKSDSIYYLSYKNNNTFTGLQEVLNKSTIKGNLVNFTEYNNKLYIQWIDTENGTSSIDRRNKRKEVYPDLGVAENLHNEYLGYDTRVNNGHLYAHCGRIFSLNENLTVKNLLFKAEDNSWSCYNNGEFKDFSTNHNIIDFLPFNSY